MSSKWLTKKVIFNTVMITFLLVAGLGMLACAPKPASTPNSLEAKVGQEFTITLESNATTGYQWQLAKPLDESMVKLVGSEYKAPQDGRVGQGGEEIWTFKAMGTGKTEVAMKYVRSWEKDVQPAEERTFTVTVK
jgi:inhibitor of cysteine peptidase